MKRILTYQIEENTTIEKFLKAKLGFSRKQISALKFREDGIWVNGKRRRVTERLLPGDLLELSVEEDGKSSSQLIPTEGTISVLYEDEDLIVVNKPEGILVHPSGGHYQDTLANLLMGYFKKKGEVPVLRSIGRLDKDTSGAVLFAKTKLAAARLSEERERGQYEKEYLAVAEGYFAEKTGEIHLPISQVPGSSPIRMEVNPTDGKKAHTYWKVERQFQDAALLRVHITTGRTHQIRVHLAGIGHPLLGDPLYGKTCGGFSRAALHAWKLILHHPVTGEKLVIEAAVPGDFKEYMGVGFPDAPVPALSPDFSCGSGPE